MPPSVSSKRQRLLTSGAVLSATPNNCKVVIIGAPSTPAGGPICRLTGLDPDAGSSRKNLSLSPGMYWKCPVESVLPNRPEGSAVHPRLATELSTTMPDKGAAAGGVLPPPLPPPLLHAAISTTKPIARAVFIFSDFMMPLLLSAPQ